MPKIKVTVVIQTKDTEHTKKAVRSYLQQSLEKDFLGEDEKITSVTVVNKK